MTSENDCVKFGNQLKLDEFNLDKNKYFLNHGSYGACPKQIYAKKQQLQMEMEAAPDKWFRITSLAQWTRNKQVLATYLKVNADNILICDNATESINAALKSIEFNGSQDAILATEYTYRAVLNTVDYVAKYRAENNPVNVFKVPLTLPINSKQQILDEFEAMCHHIVNEKRLNLRVALIDHISSATAILYPIAELIQLMRKWSDLHQMNTLILIDGAHAIGHTEIELNRWDCDFYISNLHKWFLAPRGCSFLYIKDCEKLGKHLQPNYISHGYDKDIGLNFFLRGTADKSSWYVIEECIQFYEHRLGGLGALRAHANTVLAQAVSMLCLAWDTTTLPIARDLEAPFMKMIKLPILCTFQGTEMAEKLMYELFTKYNLVTCVVCVKAEMYIRISCFVYNELDDYVPLREAILELKQAESN